MHPESLAEMTRILDGWKGTQPANLLDVGAYNVNGCYRDMVERRGWTYTGLDISDGPNVDVVALDPYAWPFADNTFDIVISGSTLEHVAHPWRWMPEAARLVRPGGMLAVITHTRFPFHRYPIDCWRVMPDGMAVLFDLSCNLERYDIRMYCETDISGVAFKEERPLLEVLTRTCRRPNWLKINQASMQAQTDTSWMQTLLPDEVGLGVVAANTRLAEVEPQAQYEWVLDDDDYCPQPRMVEILRRVVREHNSPPAIIMRTNDNKFGILPPNECWQQEPVLGTIGSSHIFARADVWRRHRAAWASGRYAADYDFIKAVWDECGAQWVWYDLVVRDTQHAASYGQPEAA